MLPSTTTTWRRLHMLVVAAVVVVAGTFSMISKNNNLVTVVEAFQQTKTSIPTFHRRQQEQQQEFLANLYKWNPTTTTTTTTTTRSSSSSPSSSSRLFMASQPPKVDKGFNLLEIATKVVPQGRIVQTTKESWKFIWKRMMTELAPQDKTGQYQRPKYTFGGTIGSTQFPIEGNGRYHLYLGNPCPWCHRVKLVIEILGLERKGIVTVTTLIDDPIKASRGGWIFANPTKDRKVGTFDVVDLRGLYDYLSPNFQGRCTAPLLIDTKQECIVSNESNDIVRMLPRLLESAVDNNQDDDQQSESDEKKIDLCPGELSKTIDETNEWIYRLLNNGVYRCGFSTTQVAYDVASKDVREGLQKCEDILSKSQYICGTTFLTESDIMLLPTILRFDGVYSPLFKAGGTHIKLKSDYPNIHKWLVRCWNDIPGVSTSIDISDATSSYYKQLFPLNPGGIIPTTVTAKELGLED